MNKTQKQTQILIIASLGLALSGCGFLQDIIDAIPEPPRPTPRVEPTPTPTPEPTQVPTQPPTQPPTPSPTPAPTSTPKPCNAPPPAPQEAVTLAYSGACPKGFEKITQYEASKKFAPAGMILCAAISECQADGHGACFGIGDRPAWRYAFDLNAGHKVLKKVGNAWLVYDAERGCGDAYGRHFPESQGCLKLYQHTDGPDAPWDYLNLAKPFVCPEPTPIPTATPVQPTPGATFPPELQHLEGWKVSNTCHALDERGATVICVKDSTQIYPPGPCDRDHPLAFFGACGGRTWDDLRGPIWTTTPSLEAEWVSSHSRRFFIPKGIGDVSFTTCPRLDVGAPVDYVTYESGGFDDVIGCGTLDCAVQREAIPRIPIPVKGTGCRSIIQRF